MKTILLSAAIFVLAFSCAKPPVRTVVNNTLTSSDRPSISIGFDKGFTYLGGQEFDLPGKALVEQHFFVADDAGIIRKMYWVQFESLTDDNPYTYNYSELPAIRVAGREFYNKSGFAQVPDEMQDDGSDQYHANSFLWDRGYDLAREGMFQRMTWLWDESSRRELMIIYVEDLGEYGYEAADFEAGGKAFGARDSMSTELLGRALAGMKFPEQAGYPGE
jgi:hypothetical protein